MVVVGMAADDFLWLYQFIVRFKNLPASRENEPQCNGSCDDWIEGWITRH